MTFDERICTICFLTITLFYAFGDTDFIVNAQKVANYFKDMIKLQGDNVPNWDFDNPDIPNAPENV